MKRCNGREWSSVGMMAFVAAIVPACAGTEPADTEQAPAAAPVAAEPSVALRIERAKRALDRGEGASKAQGELDAVLRDPVATAPERDEATLGLSRARSAAGDQDGAITALENLLAAHAGDREWAASAETERRLRKLLTGNEDAP